MDRLEYRAPVLIAERIALEVRGTAAHLDVLDADNASTYWERDERFDLGDRRSSDPFFLRVQVFLQGQVSHRLTCTCRVLERTRSAL